MKTVQKTDEATGDLSVKKKSLIKLPRIYSKII